MELVKSDNSKGKGNDEGKEVTSQSHWQNRSTIPSSSNWIQLGMEMWNRCHYQFQGFEGLAHVSRKLNPNSNAIDISYDTCCLDWHAVEGSSLEGKGVLDNLQLDYS